MIKKKYQRLIFLLVSLTLLSVATYVGVNTFRESLVFFLTPSELLQKKISDDQMIRVGGLVVKGSFEQQGSQIKFRVSDGSYEIVVFYEGLLPDLFREGQGVVAEGFFKKNVLQATQILAKHDENYMPENVAKKIKNQGHWKGKS